MPGQTDPRYPRLAGQYTDYLALQLELFEKAALGVSPFAEIMHTNVHRMTKEQMRDMEAFYASLGPGTSAP